MIFVVVVVIFIVAVLVVVVIIVAIIVIFVVFTIVVVIPSRYTASSSSYFSRVSGDSITRYVGPTVSQSADPLVTNCFFGVHWRFLLHCFCPNI